MTVALPAWARAPRSNWIWYLVSRAGQELRRECVADQFWQSSSAERQRSALNSAIWRIGKKLPRHPNLKLHATDTTLCLTIGGTIPVDMTSARWCAKPAAVAWPPDAPGGSRRHWPPARRHSSDGLNADWTLAERERVSTPAPAAPVTLMHWHGDNRSYEEALQIGRRLLCERTRSVNPCRST